MERYATELPPTVGRSPFAWVGGLILVSGILFHHWLATHYCHELLENSSHSQVLVRPTDASSGIVVDLNLGAGQLKFPAIQCSGRFHQLTTTIRDVGPGEVAMTAAMLAPFLICLATYLSANAVMPAALATWLAIGIWWTAPNVTQWANMGWETTLIGPTAGLYFAGLIRFHRSPGMFGWLALMASSMLGWSLFPFLWLIFFFPATMAWLIVAYRHGWLWHGWLILALIIGAAPFAAQWFDLFRQWPILVELGAEAIQSAWPPIIGDRATRTSLIVAQLGLLLLPCVARARHCTSALLLVGTVTCLVVTGLTQPSAKSINDAIRQTWEWPVREKSGDSKSNESPTPISIASSRMLIETEALYGSMNAEIIARSMHIPLLSGSHYGDESATWNLCQGRLAGRWISDVTDDEFRRLVERWNIGSIFAVDPATIERLKKWSVAKSPIPVAGGQLFSLDRPTRFVLKGMAIWSPQANGDLLLTDVVPEQNEVILSLRYYRNWTAGPGHISVEPEIDPYDPLPIVRLKLAGPTSRIVLRLTR